MKKNRKSSIIYLGLATLLAVSMLAATGCSKGQDSGSEQDEVPVVEEFSIEIGENEAVGGF